MKKCRFYKLVLKFVRLALHGCKRPLFQKQYSFSHLRADLDGTIFAYNSCMQLALVMSAT